MRPKEGITLILMDLRLRKDGYPSGPKEFWKDIGYHKLIMFKNKHYPHLNYISFLIGIFYMLAIV